MQFPNVTASNLHRQKVTLPQDFGGDLNVLVVAFQQWQQSLVDTWLPLLEQLEEQHPQLRAYELPTIRKMNPIARTFINEGMRAGIPDPAARDRTITLYLDKSSFRQSLDITDENDIILLLVDDTGQVLWRTTGPFEPEKAASLTAAIKNRIASSVSLQGTTTALDTELQETE